MNKAKTKIKFKPIFGAEGGEISLVIYPPGSWFDNRRFKVFIGGSGIGEKATEPAAQKLLLKQALIECDRRIADAQKSLEHYTRERQRLLAEGLVDRREVPR